MFGRKKKDDVESREELLDDETLTDADEDGIDDELEGTDLNDDDAEPRETTDEDSDDLAEDDDRDEWDELDESADWRDDGPFDIEEVELEGDTVNRVDFGTLILTPFDGMQLQLQVDQASGAVQSALVMKGNSGLEIALFAAPRSGGLAREVRREMVQQAQQAGGEGALSKGPFGTEVKRIIPMTTPDGQQAAHVSNTWLAEGPRWLLRGVLMGEACIAEDGSDHEFVEFFKNIVVRRGVTPMPQGDLITMTLPDELRQPMPGQPGQPVQQ